MSREACKCVTLISRYNSLAGHSSCKIILGTLFVFGFAFDSTFNCHLCLCLTEIDTTSVWLFYDVFLEFLPAISGVF